MRPDVGPDVDRQRGDVGQQFRDAADDGLFPVAATRERAADELVVGKVRDLAVTGERARCPRHEVVGRTQERAGLRVVAVAVAARPVGGRPVEGRRRWPRPRAPDVGAHHEQVHAHRFAVHGDVTARCAELVQCGQGGAEPLRAVPTSMRLIRHHSVFVGTERSVVLDDHHARAVVRQDAVQDMEVVVVDIQAEQVELGWYAVPLEQGSDVLASDRLLVQADIGSRVFGVEHPAAPSRLAQQPGIALRAVLATDLDVLTIGRAKQVEEVGDDSVLAVLRVALPFDRRGAGHRHSRRAGGLRSSQHVRVTPVAGRTGRSRQI